MKSLKTVLAGCFAALALSGCAGTDFVRPDPASFVLGQTTQQSITERMGAPYRTGEILKNGQTLQMATYAYAATGGDALYPGVTPARSQGFYFKNGTLVGTEFSSSFTLDGTDFDSAKLAGIRQGQTTKAEVERLLGPAGGHYIWPLTKTSSERALVYLYSQTKGTAFNLRFYVKTLAVSYNEQGIVTNVEYTTQGEKE